MEINRGDKVRFLNDIGGGIVQKILSNNLILIKTEDDFEYAVPKTELVVVKRSENIEPDEIQPTKIKENEESEKEVEYNDALINKTVEIYLAFTKIQETHQSKFRLHLLNDSGHSLLYHIVAHYSSGIPEKIDADKTEPETLVKISDFTKESLLKLKQISVQIILFGHPENVILNPIQKNIKIYPEKFLTEESFVKNDYFDEDALILTVFRSVEENLETELSAEEINKRFAGKDFSESTDSKSVSKPHKKPETIVVDLHINVLTDSVVGLSNHQILAIQMKHFHEKLTNAILNKAEKIVFIHGIGNGTLKNALRESLSAQYKLHYEDASYKDYGLGATMVLL